MSEEVTEPAERDEDAERVRAHLSGDPDAFRALYEKYRDRVYGSAYRVLGDEHEAADLTQEIFVRIHGGLRSFRFDSRFSTWLYRVAVNLAINRGQERTRHERIEKETAGDRAPRDGGRRDFDEAVQRAVMGLSPKLRAIVALRYLEGLSYEEISEVLEISMGTVKSRLFLAHETLKPLLENVRS